MPKTDFDYYYGVEAEQFTFVRVPKVLFTDKEHFGSLSNDARILYGFLLERMSLSRKNNLIDARNRVYIIFPIDEIAEIMGVCHEKALNILKELDEQNGIGLVKKKRTRRQCIKKRWKFLFFLHFSFKNHVKLLLLHIL